MNRKNAKFLAIIIAVLFLNFSTGTFAQSNGTNVQDQPLEFDPVYGLQSSGSLITLFKNPNAVAPLVLEDCRRHTGFFNKIVNCIASFTTRAEIFNKLNAINSKFAGAANAALILYVMIFGIRLSMNVIENVKGEIVIALLTCFFVTYANNAYRLDSFMKFFVGLQNEFANAAFYAMSGDPSKHNMTYTQKCPDNASGCTFNPITQQYERTITEENCLRDNRPLTIWRRMDCAVATVLGAQPLMTLLGQGYDSAVGKGSSVLSGGLGNLSTGVVDLATTTGTQQNFHYNYNTDTGSVWADLTRDPFCFFQYTMRVDNVQSVIDSAGNVLTNSCFDKYGSLSLGQATEAIAKEMRPVKNDRFESYMTFSIIIIIVGALTNDPALGLTIFISGFFVAILMLAAFAQVTLVYITSLFAIMVLGLFAPLILPCVLFKPTQNIFNKWVQMLFAYSLQPGILICYISFMLYVLLFALSFKSIGVKNGVSCVDINPESQYYRFNPECKGAVPSFKEFVFLLFRQGEIGYKDVMDIKVVDNTDSNRDYVEKIMAASGTVRNTSQDEEQMWSLMSSGDNPFNLMGYQMTTETKDEILGSGYQIGNSGVSTSSFNVPSFSFAGGFNAVMKQAIKYDPLSADLEASLQRGEQNTSSEPISGALGTGLGQKPIEEQAAELARIKKADYKFTIGFMQTLMMIFAVLAVTFSFMGTVMELGGKLAGASVIPVAGVNVYKMAAGKMSRFLGS
jgi:type IV secretory pathway VirB6-like protein